MSVGRIFKPDKIKSISLLAKHYEANWKTNSCQYFFKNAFDRKTANSEENQPDENGMVVLLDNEDDALRV